MREVKSITARIVSDFKSMAEIIMQHTKIIAEITILLLFLMCMFNISSVSKADTENTEKAQNTVTPEHHRIIDTVIPDEQEEIRNEIFYGELEELAILVQAEAGNQDELGKRYVADCVLNRLDSDKFPDKLHDVIFQLNPTQFSSTIDGNYAKAEWTVTEDCFQIALDEYVDRTNSEIKYFRTERYGDGIPAFKYGDHYFSK